MRALVAGGLVQQHQGLVLAGPGLAFDFQLQAMGRQLRRRITQHLAKVPHQAGSDQTVANAAGAEALTEQDVGQGAGGGLAQGLISSTVRWLSLAGQAIAAMRSLISPER